MTRALDSVEIKKVENGYMVVITPVENESFFDDFEQMISYLKFYFNVKEEAEEG